ncbi:hypothetical protein MAR_020676, partial [Mya arenaria]
MESKELRKHLTLHLITVRNIQESYKDAKTKQEKRQIRRAALKKSILKKYRLNKYAKQIFGISSNSKTTTKKRPSLLKIMVVNFLDRDDNSRSTNDPFRPLVLSDSLIGSYCVVDYEGLPYPGLIMDVDEDTVEVTAMCRIGPNRFFWPLVEDRLWYGKEKLITFLKRNRHWSQSDTATLTLFVITATSDVITATLSHYRNSSLWQALRDLNGWSVVQATGSCGCFINANLCKLQPSNSVGFSSARQTSTQPPSDTTSELYDRNSMRRYGKLEEEISEIENHAFRTQIFFKHKQTISSIQTTTTWTCSLQSQNICSQMTLTLANGNAEVERSLSDNRNTVTPERTDLSFEAINGLRLAKDKGKEETDRKKMAMGEKMMEGELLQKKQEEIRKLNENFDIQEKSLKNEEDEFNN